MPDKKLQNDSKAYFVTANDFFCCLLFATYFVADVQMAHRVKSAIDGFCIERWIIPSEEQTKVSKFVEGNRFILLSC